MDRIEKQMIDIVNRNHRNFRNRDIDALAERLNAVSARRKSKRKK